MTNSEILVVTVYFFLSISLLVVMHELGHYLTARYFKTKVEKFFLFFDPWFALLKKRIGDTEYGIGWLPLGGYVKIAGMVDESMDTEELSKPPKPWEFRSKPAWQRLIIMLGGIIVNILLGIVIFAMLLWKDGEVNLPPQNIKTGMYFSELMHQAGFENGDIVEKVNGQELKNYKTWEAKLIMGDGQSSIDIQRDGKPMHIPVSDETILALQNQKDTVHMQPQIPFLVDSVMAAGPSYGKLMPGDVVYGVDSSAPLYIQEIMPILSQNKNKPVNLLVERNNQKIHVPITPDSNGKLQVVLNLNENKFFKIDTLRYGFFQSLAGGVRYANTAFRDQAKGMYKMATDDKVSAKDNLGGFITIAKLFPWHWGDWERFWQITGILSFILAFMNLLPIPGLDGGHVMFLIYEMISGKAPSLKFQEVAQVAGMILVLGLILYINGREIIQAFFS